MMLGAQRNVSRDLIVASSLYSRTAMMALDSTIGARCNKIHIV